MFLTIGLFVIATLAVAVYLVWPRTPPAQLHFEDAPDAPVGFGKDMCWLAVRSPNTRRVLAELGLKSARACNWKTGIAAVYDPKFRDRLVFVSPPVDGWTFIVGRSLPHPIDSDRLQDSTEALLAKLAMAFAEVHFFMQFGETELTAWARCRDGELERFHASSERGAFLERGRPTRIEKRIGLQHFDMVGLRERSGDVGGPLMLVPRPEHVFMIAADWGIDPMKLGKLTSVAPAHGWIAGAPRAWALRWVPPANAEAA